MAPEEEALLLIVAVLLIRRRRRLRQKRCRKGTVAEFVGSFVLIVCFFVVKLIMNTDLDVVNTDFEYRF